MSPYLVSIRWPGNSRTAAVGESFTLGASPFASLWVPEEVMDSAELEEGLVAVRVVERADGLALKLGDRDVVAEWSSGDVTVSLARLPENLQSLEGSSQLHGQSVAMRRLLRDIRLAAPSEASVLIHGETGTGKEHIARSLHAHSPRREKPYVVIDCTAVSDTLFESELFGHVKGSFSGASTNRVGPFEEADGGTVFIDEIGEIPLAMQPKLLRVLESGTVRRVGENTHRKVDVRVIGATHRDLHKMVQEGTFRGDLYYRLAVLELKSPPLRERHGDLALLLRRFVGDELFEQLEPEQWDAIETHPWLGNIRELRNFAQRAATHGWNALFNREDDAAPSAMSASSPRKSRPSKPAASEDPSTSEIALPELPAAARNSTPPQGEATSFVPRANDPRDGETLADFRARWMHDGEALYLKTVLRRAGGSITKAAKMAEVDRTHLHRVLRKHGLSKSGERKTK